MGFPDSSVGKESACNAGGPGSIPGLGRSAGEGIGYPLQYSDLENFMDCIVHGVAKNRTQMSDFHFHFLFSLYMCVYIYYICVYVYIYVMYTYMCIYTYTHITHIYVYVIYVYMCVCVYMYMK